MRFCPASLCKRSAEHTPPTTITCWPPHKPRPLAAVVCYGQRRADESNENAPRQTAVDSFLRIVFRRANAMSKRATRRLHERRRRRSPGGSWQDATTTYTAAANASEINDPKQLVRESNGVKTNATHNNNNSTTGPSVVGARTHRSPEQAHAPLQSDR